MIGKIFSGLYLYGPFCIFIVFGSLIVWVEPHQRECHGPRRLKIGKIVSPKEGEKMFRRLMMLHEAGN